MYNFLIVIGFRGNISILDSERSDECIDFIIMCVFFYFFIFVYVITF